MFNFFLFVFLFFLVIVIAGIAVVVHVVRRGLRFFHGVSGDGAHRTANTHGRRHRASGGRWRAAHASSGETVIDLRDTAVANRRIFADDEGEYVDFEEIKMR